MHYCFFSDLHIKRVGDESSKIAEKLFNHPDIQGASHLYFLGDIFDLMIGEHSEHFSLHSCFFKNIVQLLDNDVKICFLEGNHDFHFEKSLKHYIQENSGKPENFFYKQDGFKLNIGEREFYICHGDEVDYANIAFKRWKRIYRSGGFKLLVNKLLPYSFISHVGNKASQDSKKRGSKKFDYENAQLKYREGAHLLAIEKNVDGIISGHTHIQEFHEFSDGKIYLNCGFPLKDQNFLKIDSDIQFVAL